jgi:C-terminal processing protease CtpA/Prc
MAPPGKLGIIIDTTLLGPTIHQVNDHSPMVDLLFTGEIIAAINGIDTQCMSIEDITSLMAQTTNQERKLTVLSEDIQ